MILLLRTTLVWLTTTAGCALVAWWAAPDPARLTASEFDVVLAGAAGVVLAGCAAWCWLVTTSVVVEVLTARGPLPVAGRSGWLRRAVLLACGLAVLSTPAVAMQPVAPLTHDSPAGPNLDGLPLPDRTVGGLVTAPPPPTPLLVALAEPPPVAGVGHVRVVRTGESLWSVACDLHPPGTDSTRIARAVTAIYAANRAAIGPDPDLIHPGLRLQIPRPLLNPERHSS